MANKLSFWILSGINALLTSWRHWIKGWDVNKPYDATVTQIFIDLMDFNKFNAWDIKGQTKASIKINYDRKDFLPSSRHNILYSNGIGNQA